MQPSHSTTFSNGFPRPHGVGHSRCPRRASRRRDPVGDPGMGGVATPEAARALKRGVGNRPLPAGPLAGAEVLGADAAAVRQRHVLGPGASREGRSQQRPLRSHGVQEGLHHRRRASLDPSQAAQGTVQHDAVPLAHPESREIPGQAIPW